MTKFKSYLVIIMAIAMFLGISGCAVQEEVVQSNEDKAGNSSISQLNTLPDEKGVELNEESEVQSDYNEVLLKENEEVIISFTSVDSSEVVTLCKSNLSDYIVFRYARFDEVKVEFPRDLDESWSDFKYSYYFRGGGAQNEVLDLNYILFQFDGNSYEIFQEYSSDDELYDVGLRVVNLSTNEERIIQANSASILGSLISLRDSEKIEIEIQ